MKTLKDYCKVLITRWFNLTLKANNENTIYHNGLEYKEVVSPHTGRVWLDRNLGAKRVAKTCDDEEAYGDYYQWGRDSDGHEKASSETTIEISFSNTPNHSKFIEGYPNWCNIFDKSLWQGINGKNNPCPAGYRIPTIEELKAETEDQKSNNRHDIFNSFLKIPSAGFRHFESGSMQSKNNRSYLWSCSIIDNKTQTLDFDDLTSWDHEFYQAHACSIRCIKDDNSFENTKQNTNIPPIDTDMNLLNKKETKDSNIIIHNGLEYKEVVSPHTGRVWLDRNLGAKRVAKTLDDEEAYGDYYQWGRDSDGHEKSTSLTTSVLSSSNTPNHPYFIVDRFTNWFDKLDDTSLWQGIHGKNNPSPPGYRIPTMKELKAETLDQGWESKSNEDMFNSFLRLPRTGIRRWKRGNIHEQGEKGFIWSSSYRQGRGEAYVLYLSVNEAVATDFYCSEGGSIRCIKD